MGMGSFYRMDGSRKDLLNTGMTSIVSWRRCICWGLLRRRMHFLRTLGMHGVESLIPMAVTTTSGLPFCGLISIPLRGLIFADGARLAGQRWIGLRTAGSPHGRIVSGAIRI